MKKNRSYQDYLIESLKDPEEASAYLKACLDEAIETNEFSIIQSALRNVRARSEPLPEPTSLS